jgi:hypothetical protein
MATTRGAAVAMGSAAATMTAAVHLGKLFDLVSLGI